MTREEKLNKILEMSVEIVKLQNDEISEDEIDDVYIKTKFVLETLKELKKKD